MLDFIKYQLYNNWHNLKCWWYSEESDELVWVFWGYIITMVLVFIFLYGEI